ncbi:MAG: arginine repressor [Elusimicrobiota bacterium]
MMNKHAVEEDPKLARQEALLEAIRKDSFGTQQELVGALKKAGVSATQASVSRDIAELGLVKASGKYQPAPSPSSAADDPELPLRAYVARAASAGPNLVVLKTSTGTAQQVGLTLDKLARPGLVGTIAGDDSVFLAFDDKKSSDAFLEYLSEIIEKGAA